MTALILKRASASRPTGQWNDDDFDVLADATVEFFNLSLGTKLTGNEKQDLVAFLRAL